MNERNTGLDQPEPAEPLPAWAGVRFRSTREWRPEAVAAWDAKVEEGREGEFRTLETAGLCVFLLTAEQCEPEHLGAAVAAARPRRHRADLVAFALPFAPAHFLVNDLGAFGIAVVPHWADATQEERAWRYVEEYRQLRQEAVDALRAA